MQLEPGDTIGEFHILEVIGSGGFSIVYRAEDTNLLREVAIKQLSADVFSEDGSREWFVREARLAASLNHPNIVGTYALREQGDSLFLVMEYLPGGDLHTLIEQTGPLNRGILLQVATNVCHALETLHARNVIHRDIKPENILIADEGHFKLADFGLAHIRQVHHASRDDGSGPQPGTLMYMSPEQALGQQVTTRSDIYSLAVVLYEAMTAHYYLDFDLASDDEDALLALIADEPPIYPDAHHSSVPDELATPLLRALEKDPDLRPRTAREFLNEIRSAVSRSKRSTLSQKRRTLEAGTVPPSSELLHELYVVRTLRDAQHRPDLAQERLRAIWDTHPTLPEVAAEWGETLVALDDIEGGREWLERAVRLKPNLPFAQLALADIYRDVDENEDEANDALLEAIHADPDLAYAVLYEDIVASLQTPDSYETFVALFTRAAEDQAPPCAPCFHTLGVVLALHPDHHAESIAAFQTALDLDPNYGPAYVGLASLLLDLGRTAEAVPLLEQATYRYFPALLPDDWHKGHTVYQRPHAFLALAVTYAGLEQYENSVIAATTVLDLNPVELEEDANALLNSYVQAAERWIRAGDHLRTYKLLNQAIPLAAHWGKVEVFTLLGVTQSKIGAEYRRQGQWDDAIDWLKAGLLTLQENESPSQEARQRAAEAHDELKKAQQQRRTQK